jgi:hypothetical protein
VDARLKTLLRSKLGMLTTHREKRAVDASLLVNWILFPLMMQFVNPSPGKTTDWRAVCGRSACTVRREGEQDALPTPITPRTTLDSRFRGNDGFNSPLCGLPETRCCSGFKS